jgi:hypothetical protein
VKELPRPLRPWAEPLQLFGELVREGIGDWLLPLRAAIGAMSIPHGAREGDPDGFDGLARRGSYERLLVSEWAIAIDLPDEFLRRAVMGEHVFLAPAFVEPRGARTSVALLDCGPLQLGAPRLVQLAALVVLAQRATDAGSAFRFGVLQDASCHLHTLDPAGTTAWLASRCWRSAASHCAAWDDALAKLAPNDVWLVGAAELLPWAARLRAGLLEIEEIVAPSDRRVRVRAHQPRAEVRTTELDLPPLDTSVQILRAPLRPVRKRARMLGDRTLVPGVPGQLSGDGRRWLLPTRVGGVDALHVPNTVDDVLGRTKGLLPRVGLRLIGADVFRSRLVAVCVDQIGKLHVLGSGYDGGWSRSLGALKYTELAAPPSFTSRSEGGAIAVAPDGTARRGSMRQLLDATIYVTHAETGRFEAWILTGERELWQLRIVAKPTLDLVEPDCLDLRRVAPGVVAWVSGTRRCVSSSVGDPPGQEDLHDLRLTSVRFGGARHAFPSDVVYGYVDEHEFVVHGPSACRFPYPRGFGLGLLTSSALVYLDTDDRTVRVTGGTHPLFTAPEPLPYLRYEPSCDCIVWATASGARGVYSVVRKSMLLRLDPNLGDPR